jgi:heat shock protein HslJ
MKSVDRRVSVLASVALAALVLAGCSTGSPGASATPQISPLANSEWSLTTIFGRPLPSGTNASLIFAVLEAGGFSGCNQFTMPYATQDTGLRFGPIAGTRKSCGQALDAVETSYYTNLALVTHYSITGDTLNLTSATNETVLAYARMAPATVDGPWNITSVNNGNNGVESVPTGVSATISFLPNNLLEGFGGCNNFNGDYLVVGTDNISFGPIMSTMKACGDPADSFERQLLVALPTATKWSVSNGTLELRDASGALQVQATTAMGH